MNIHKQLVLDIMLVILRNAWLISLACSPILASPTAPSISALGVNAATESITHIPILPVLISFDAISKQSSPQSGCENNSLSTSTPRLDA